MTSLTCRTSRTFRLAAFLCLLFVSALLLPQPAPAALTEKGRAEIQTILRDRIDREKRSVGIVVGVINKDGNEIISYGKTDKGSGKNVNGNTVFEIGSVTKVFTTLLLADMVKRGELSLDDPVSKFLPKSVRVPSSGGKEITLLSLATHSSGLPRMPNNVMPKDPGNPFADYSVAQMYTFLSNYKLTRPIGSQYEYSNLGAGLLGHILSLRSGMDYETLVVKRICNVLDMPSTRIKLSPELQLRLAVGHNQNGDPAANWDMGALAGAGAIRSTANDMVRFVSANMGLFESSLHPAMQETQVARISGGLPDLEIALGWHIRKKFGTEIVWHNGQSGGYHSFIGFAPDSLTGVVVLSNSVNNIDDIGLHILDSRYDVSRDRAEARIDPKIYDAYVGQYEVTSGLHFFIRHEGDSLTAQLTGQSRIQIFPETETRFFYKVVDAQIDFVKDEKGKVTQLILHQGGQDMPAQKISAVVPKEKERRAISVAPAVLDGYAGDYEITPDFTLTVTAVDGRLFAQATAQPQFEIFAETETQFFYKELDAQITFARDVKGVTTHLVLHQAGQEWKARKIR